MYCIVTLIDCVRALDFSFSFLKDSYMKASLPLCYFMPTLLYATVSCQTKLFSSDRSSLRYDILDILYPAVAN